MLGGLWAVIRTVYLTHFSEWVVCSVSDPTKTGRGVCRVAQLVLKSVAVRQQGSVHQKRCVINHHSSSELVPTLFPIWQKEKEAEERMTVASHFQEWQETTLALTPFEPSSGHQ